MEGRLTKQEKIFLKKILDRISELREIFNDIEKRHNDFMPRNGTCEYYENFYTGRCTRCFMRVRKRCLATVPLNSPADVKNEVDIKNALKHANEGLRYLPFENASIQRFVKKLIELNYILRTNDDRIMVIRSKSVIIRRLFNTFTFGSFGCIKYDPLIIECYKIAREED